MTIWTQLRYFKIRENWGDPWHMNGAFLLALDTIRHYYNDDERFIIHCAYELEGHKSGGDHPLGNGADLHIENILLKTAYEKMLGILNYLQLDEVMALGVYPEWNNPGFHLGLRGSKARWCKKGGIYLGIDKSFE